MRNEIDQDPVEQIDVIGPEIRDALQEQLGDPARGLGQAFGIALPDDLIEPGNERGSNRHAPHPNRPHRRVLRRNLGRLW